MVDPLGSENSPSPEFDRSRVSFNIWLGLHVTASDLGDLGRLIQRGGYDLYIPEDSERHPDSDRAYKQLVRGDRKIYERAMAQSQPDSFTKALFSAMYASRVNLLLVDYTEAQLKADEDHQVLSVEHSLREFPTIDDTISYCQEITERAARTYARRDDNIVKNINDELPRLVEEHPKLKERDDIKALLSIGVLHVLLPQKLAAQGYPVSIIHQPSVLTPLMELSHKFQHGEEIGRDLLVRSALDAFIEPVMIHPDTTRRAAIIRQITESVPEDAVKNLIENHQIYGAPLLAEFVNLWLEHLGISDPDLIIDGSGQRKANIL